MQNLSLPTTYPTVAYDTALPQPWVDDLISRGFDPRGVFVWAYPPTYIFGIPYPLTPIAAHKFLSRTPNATFYIAAWLDARSK